MNAFPLIFLDTTIQIERVTATRVRQKEITIALATNRLLKILKLLAIVRIEIKVALICYLKMI